MFNLQRKFLGLAVSVAHPSKPSPSELLLKIATDYLDDQAANREQVRILRRQLVADISAKTARPEPEYPFELVNGTDGIQYEIREAVQRDLSIIHTEDPAVAYNNGWRRIGVNEDGSWAGMMARPSDPELRAKNLAEYMRHQQTKSVTFDTPVGENAIKLGPLPSVESLLANADDANGF